MRYFPYTCKHHFGIILVLKKRQTRIYQKTLNCFDSLLSELVLSLYYLDQVFIINQLFTFISLNVFCISRSTRQNPKENFHQMDQQIFEPSRTDFLLSNPSDSLFTINSCIFLANIKSQRSFRGPARWCRPHFPPANPFEHRNCKRMSRFKLIPVL